MEKMPLKLVVSDRLLPKSDTVHPKSGAPLLLITRPVKEWLALKASITINEKTIKTDIPLIHTMQ